MLVFKQAILFFYCGCERNLTVETLSSIKNRGSFVKTCRSHHNRFFLYLIFIAEVTLLDCFGGATNRTGNIAHVGGECKRNRLHMLHLIPFIAPFSPSSLEFHAAVRKEMQRLVESFFFSVHSTNPFEQVRVTALRLHHHVQTKKLSLREMGEK